MIRIVVVNRHADPGAEFVLLQNQGSLRQNLRGMVVISDEAIDATTPNQGFHTFSESELIPAGSFVLLRTGVGIPRWTKTKDGQLIYNAYMGRSSSVWGNEVGQIHVLATQHTWVERAEPLRVR